MCEYQEREAAVLFKGNPATLLGPEIKVGDTAPDFQVVDNGLQPVTLATDAGKVRQARALAADIADGRLLVQGVQREQVLVVGPLGQVLHGRVEQLLGGLGLSGELHHHREQRL